MGFLDGRSALVTGAAQGLGAAFASALAAAGARVVCCDVRASVSEVAERLPGADTLGIVADVGQPDDVLRVLGAARDAFGGVDLLVNNAGVFRVTHPADPWDRALADYEAIVGTNLRGVFLVGRAVASALVEEGRGGDIVNVSTDHVLPPPGRPTGGGSRMDLYDASKWALRGLSEAWSRALARHHIRVNELCLGATDTAMLRGLYPGEPPAEEVATWMRPEAIAALLIELLREGPEGRTGQQIGIWTGHDVALP